MKRKTCIDCKHFRVCGYRQEFKTREMIRYNLPPFVNESALKIRKEIYLFQAKMCDFFDKDCYSKLSKKEKVNNNDEKI